MRWIERVFTLLILTVMATVMATASVNAEDNPSISDLEERIEALESRVSAAPEEAGEASKPERKARLHDTLAEEKFLEEGIELVPGVTLSGLLEVEANYETLKKSEGGYEHNSDLTLATFELGLDVDVIKYLHAHALLLWEEDDTEPIDLDEGIITLGAEEDFPYYLSAGKMYVPFGVYESRLISDPLTLELGETRETAVLLGIEHDLFSASLGAFKGDVQETDRDSRINNLVAAVNFTPMEGLAAGVSYLTDIADSDGLVESIPDGEVAEYVGGISSYFIFEVGPVTLNGEYVGALKKFEGIPDSEGKGTDLEGMAPKAWNFEAAFLFEDMDWEVALRYEGSNDFPGFPIGQGGVCVSWGVFPNTTLAAEYLYGEFKNDDKLNRTTVQLAFEF